MAKTKLTCGLTFENSMTDSYAKFGDQHFCAHALTPSDPSKQLKTEVMLKMSRKTKTTEKIKFGIWAIL